MIIIIIIIIMNETKQNERKQGRLSKEYSNPIPSWRPSEMPRPWGITTPVDLGSLSSFTFFIFNCFVISRFLLVSPRRPPIPTSTVLTQLAVTPYLRTVLSFEVLSSCFTPETTEFLCICSRHAILPRTPGLFIAYGSFFRRCTLHLTGVCFAHVFAWASATARPT